MYDSSVLRFSAASSAVCANASVILEGVLDPTFSFSGYQQRTLTINSGIYANYHVLTISIQASLAVERSPPCC